MSKLIIGCGYLGLPTARLWTAAGTPVFAMTREPSRAKSFAQHGIEPLIGDVTNLESLPILPKVDTVLIAVGMDRTRYADVDLVYVQGLKNVLRRLTDPPSHLIYISTTGVFGDFGGDWVDETSPTQPKRPGGEACLKAENLLRQSDFADRTTILRFAGIYGPGRIPTRDKIESGQWKKLSAEGFLNLIHVEDGARVIDRFAASPATGNTFIVSDGQPVLRQQYYGYIARLLNLKAIPWEKSAVDAQTHRSGSNKRVSNQKLRAMFPDFQFEYPDYQSGLRQALSAKL